MHKDVVACANFNSILSLLSFNLKLNNLKNSLTFKPHVIGKPNNSSAYHYQKEDADKCIAL